MRRLRSNGIQPSRYSKRVLIYLIALSESDHCAEAQELQPHRQRGIIMSVARRGRIWPWRKGYSTATCRVSSQSHRGTNMFMEKSETSACVTLHIHTCTVPPNEIIHLSQLLLALLRRADNNKNITRHSGLSSSHKYEFRGTRDLASAR
jgi:hypothetical protein